MNRLTRNWMMKTFFVSLFVFIPSLHGMVAELTEEAPSILRQLERDGATPLHLAAYLDHVEEVERLIAEGTPIDAKNAKGATPLHFAAKRGSVRAVQSLIVNKANVNAYDGLGFSPLYYATQERKLPVIRCLLENGAHILKEGSDKSITSLHIAALNGDLAALECMFQIKGHQDCISSSHDCWMSPLHCAAESGSVAVIDFLIQSGEAVSVRDKNGDTPLLIAAWRGKLDALKCLLGHGASLAEENKDKQQALHCAAEGGHVKVLNFLIDQRLDVNSCGSLVGMQPPVISAFLNGHVKATEVLLSRGARINGLSDRMGHAGKSGSVAMLKVLLKHGAAINEPDFLGSTALCYAARFGHVEATNFLLGQGACIDIQGYRRVNALHEAAHNGHVNVIKALLASGADIEAVTTMTPLKRAIFNKKSEAMRFLISSGARVEPKLFEIVLSLQGRGSSIRECFQVLLETGCPVNTSTVERALATQSSAIVRMLIRAHPECIADLLWLDKRDFADKYDKIPRLVGEAANEYFKKRTSYVSEKCFKAGDNPDAVFAVAAYFLDWQVMKIFKDQWPEKLRSWRDAEGKESAYGSS